MIKIDPSATMSVTVTRGCPMGCPHCGGHYLRHMVHVDDMEKYVDKYNSFLISGGMMPDGHIPFEGYIPKLYDLKKRYDLKYNFHIGFPEDTPSQLDDLADVVSFDMFGDSTILKNIYNISRTPKEILEVVTPLKAKKVPHITIGVMRGKITHEYAAIDLLSKYFSTVVLNVFIPTAQTKFQDCTPPSVEEVGEVFKYASERLENVVLGCMQPRGEYRKRLQEEVQKYVDFLVKPVNKSVNKSVDTSNNSNDKINDKIHDFCGCCAFRV